MGVNKRKFPPKSLHDDAMTQRSKIKKNLMILLPLHLLHPILATTRKKLMTHGMILGCGI
jgi:hypothetical protein